ncbi:hypothetical protein RF11_07052 [Thelohanellus kitauei]|uniref:ISXO2-like transposase domain-containing protein n=1 Tax=Thelohanellus kitauei TaxID=669202 RepID=A0A0C2NEL7_THEKT|nr:hypothetical protein RF11_07052 [Thelohanellus kitauei]
MDSLLEVFASENSAAEYFYSKNILTENRNGQDAENTWPWKNIGYYFAALISNISNKRASPKLFLTLKNRGKQTPVTEWTRFIRQLLADNVDSSDTVICGNEIVVEGEQKKKKCFVDEVENEDSKTMEDILFRHILPITIIYTDMGKAYNQPSNDLGLNIRQ